ncbi:MAG: hypothetical protein AB1801_24855, partial [Chloroflexota bacterium]
MIPTFKQHLLSTFFLILALLALFWPALLHPDTILFPTFSPFSDVVVIHWPKANLLAQSWQSGAGLPLWTPLILSGMPLAANQLAMLFYPLAWLFLILPPELVFNLLFIFHLLLGGLGVYFLLTKGYGLSPAAALPGSLTFALNGKWLAHVAAGHVSMVGAIGWLPWAVLGTTMALKPPGSRGDHKPALFAGMNWVIVAAVALAMQIATHTLLVIYTVYLLAALVVWRMANEELRIAAKRSEWPRSVATKRGKERRAAKRSKWQIAIHSFADSPTRSFADSPTRPFAHSLIRLFAILFLAGLLGAAQLLPLAELAQFSNRSLSLSQAAEFAVTPAQLLVGLLLPSTRSGHELIIYLGLAPLLLAPFGFSRSNRWSWFYGGLFILSVLFALGPSTPVHGLFY